MNTTTHTVRLDETAGADLDVYPTEAPSRLTGPDRSRRRRSAVTVAAIGVAAIVGVTAGWSLRSWSSTHSQVEPAAAPAVAAQGPSEPVCHVGTGGVSAIGAAVDACLAHTSQFVPDDAGNTPFSMIAAIRLPTTSQP
jgi:hypothetical protein